MKKRINNLSDMEEFAKDLALRCKDGALIALSGPLGAGKTTFSQFFAKSLGITQQLISPTFVLMRIYKIPEKKIGKLFHIDLYRLENSNQIEQLGMGEVFEDPNNIVLIEWAEKLGDKMPNNATKIHIKPQSDGSRIIQITGLDAP